MTVFGFVLGLSISNRSIPDFLSDSPERMYTRIEKLETVRAVPFIRKRRQRISGLINRAH